MKDAGSKKTFEGLGESLRDVGPYLTVGLQLAAAVVGFFFIGYWADQKLGTSPWGSLAGVVIGSAGGFIKFFRSVGQMNRSESSGNKDHREN